MLVLAEQTSGEPKISLRRLSSSKYSNGRRAIVG